MGAGGQALSALDEGTWQELAEVLAYVRGRRRDRPPDARVAELHRLLDREITARRLAAGSPRRRILEEVLEDRSKVVAMLGLEDEDPPAGSWQWPVGISRVVAPAFGLGLERRRRMAKDVMIVALAWLEQIDRELETETSGPPAR